MQPYFVCNTAPVLELHSPKLAEPVILQRFSSCTSVQHRYIPKLLSSLSHSLSSAVGNVYLSFCCLLSSSRFEFAVYLYVPLGLTAFASLSRPAALSESRVAPVHRCSMCWKALPKVNQVQIVAVFQLPPPPRIMQELQAVGPVALTNAFEFQLIWATCCLVVRGVYNHGCHYQAYNLLLQHSFRLSLQSSVWGFAGPKPTRLEMGWTSSWGRQVLHSVQSVRCFTTWPLVPVAMARC